MEILRLLTPDHGSRIIRVRRKRGITPINGDAFKPLFAETAGTLKTKPCAIVGYR